MIYDVTSPLFKSFLVASSGSSKCVLRTAFLLPVLLYLLFRSAAGVPKAPKDKANNNKPAFSE